MLELNNKNFISIIMPAYNCEKYIELSIRSVISQTFTNWELIVIEDCSTDNTLRIILELCKIDDRIIVYNNLKNEGVSFTRNRGINLAKGEWIAFIDSDDMWVKTKLEKQLEIVKKTFAEFVFTGSSYINENNIYYKGEHKVPEILNFNKLKYQNVIPCSSVLIKKKYFETVKMEYDNVHEDYVAWLKILKLGLIAYGLNEPLLIYRITLNSRSGNKLKSFRKTFGVFRIVGFTLFESLIYTISHLVLSIIKYRNIIIRI